MLRFIDISKFKIINLLVQDEQSKISAYYIHLRILFTYVFIFSPEELTALLHFPPDT